MAALTATFWTQTVQERNIEGKKKRNRVLLTLSSTQAGTYPSSGGIPIPTTLGMVRNVDYVHIIQDLVAASSATGKAINYTWHYVVTEHSIHGYQPQYTVATALAGTNPSSHVTELAELPNTWNPSDLGTAPVMLIEAVGW